MGTLVKTVARFNSEMGGVIVIKRGKKRKIFIGYGLGDEERRECQLEREEEEDFYRLWFG